VPLPALDRYELFGRFVDLEQQRVKDGLTEHHWLLGLSEDDQRGPTPSPSETEPNLAAVVLALVSAREPQRDPITWDQLVENRSRDAG
jgi:hypothetical protein